MNRLTWIFSVIALLALPFFSKAQLGGSGTIQIVYEGYLQAPGALKVSTNTGASHEYYTYPSSHGFAGFTSFTFDWSHGRFPGWGTRKVTVNKSTFNAQLYGTTSNHYYGSSFRYQVTKDYGYSTPGGTTYDYVLRVKVYDPRL